MALRLFYAAAIALIAYLVLVSTGRANHNVFLPLTPNTPLMQQVIKNQEYTYCLDARAAAYPNFAGQLRDVTAEYEKRVGVRAREVAFSDTSCQVKHTMPDGLNCVGWAAQIFYANWPVTVQYCWTLGYVDWRSAQGHEIGHGVLGLHEQYNDSGGNIGCTGRQDTVMDCGGNPPVRYPQSLDVSRGCTLIATSWCGKAPVTCTSYPCWTGSVWKFNDGFAYDPANGNWLNPVGQVEWLACNQDQIRFNPPLALFAPPGSGFWTVPSRGFWSFSPAC